MSAAGVTVAAAVVGVLLSILCLRSAGNSSESGANFANSVARIARIVALPDANAEDADADTD